MIVSRKYLKCKYVNYCDPYSLERIWTDIHTKNLNNLKILIGLGTDSLNVSANIDIDSDSKCFETQKPLFFVKTQDIHTYGNSKEIGDRLTKC